MSESAQPSGSDSQAGLTGEYIRLNPLLVKDQVAARPQLAKQRDDDGRTPLFWAVSNNQPELVDFLVPHSDLAAADDAGWTVLHVAASISLELTTKVLGAPLEAKTNSGATALQLAVSKDKKSVVQRLIEQGSSAKSKDKAGRTALMRAVNLPEMTAFLLSQGVPVNATDNNGWTALHYAASEGQLDVVQLLVAHGADAAIENSDGKPALMESPNLDTAKKIKALINK